MSMWNVQMGSWLAVPNIPGLSPTDAEAVKEGLAKAVETKLGATKPHLDALQSVSGAQKEDAILAAVTTLQPNVPADIAISGAAAAKVQWIWVGHRHEIYTYTKPVNPGAEVPYTVSTTHNGVKYDGQVRLMLDMVEQP